MEAAHSCFLSGSSESSSCWRATPSSTGTIFLCISFSQNRRQSGLTNRGKCLHNRCLESNIIRSHDRMSIYPSPDKLDSLESKYALVILAAKRARQIKDNARRLVE